MPSMEGVQKQKKKARLLFFCSHSFSFGQIYHWGSQNWLAICFHCPKHKHGTHTIANTSLTILTWNNQYSRKSTSLESHCPDECTQCVKYCWNDKQWACSWEGRACSWEDLASPNTSFTSIETAEMINRNKFGKHTDLIALTLEKITINMEYHTITSHISGIRQYD